MGCASSVPAEGRVTNAAGAKEAPAKQKGELNDQRLACEHTNESMQRRRLSSAAVMRTRSSLGSADELLAIQVFLCLMTTTPLAR